MKIICNRDGEVTSRSRGSIEQHQFELLCIMTYIQQRVDTYKSIDANAEAKVKRERRSTAKEIRAEYAEMGGRC